MKDDFDVGYVCGALCARGHVVWDEKRKHYTITLEIKNDEFAKVFSERISHIVPKVIMLNLKKTYRGRMYITNVIRIYGKEVIRNLFNENKLKVGCRDWKVPPRAYKDERFRKGFLQGYFDGDGHVNVRLRKHKNGKLQRRWSIKATSANKDGLIEIKKLLYLEGVKSYVYQTGNYFVVEIDGKTNVMLFKNNVNFGVKNKREKLESSLIHFNSSYPDSNELH